MACSDVQDLYIGGGSTTIDGNGDAYTITFEYLQQSDVRVAFYNFVTEVWDDQLSSSWSFLTLTTIEFDTAPPAPTTPGVDNVKIYRNTALTNLKAIFNPGSAIRAQDLNNNFEQLFFAAQETECYGGSGGGISGGSINDLVDVEIDTPTDGQILEYNGTTNKWENEDWHQANWTEIDATNPSYIQNKPDLSGNLIFLGTRDCVANNPVGTEVAGNFYVNTANGNANAGWTGIAGDVLVNGDRVVLDADGINWSVLAVGIMSIGAGTGISLTGTTSSPIINVADTTVTAGSYTNTNLTVDAQGRITAASDGTSGTSNMPTGGSGEDAFYENTTTIDNNYSITSGKNAGTFGPVTVNGDVTVPNGSVWTVVGGSGGGGNNGGTVINYNGASAWANANRITTSLVVPIANSLNIASIDRTGTGKYTANFATPMPNADYAVTGTVNDVANNNPYVTFTVISQTSTSFDYVTSFVNYDNGATIYFDSGHSFTVFATNAIAPPSGAGADAWVTAESNQNITGSFNVASVTKQSTGKYLVTFTTPMPNDKYAAVCTAASFTSYVTDRSATSFVVNVKNGSGTDFDAAFSAVVHASSTVTPTFTWTREGTTLKPANTGDTIKAASGKFGTNGNANITSEGILSITRQNESETVLAGYLGDTNTAYIQANGQIQTLSNVVASGYGQFAGGMAIGASPSSTINCYVKTVDKATGLYSSNEWYESNYAIQGICSNGAQSQYGVYGTVTTDSTYSSGGILGYSINSSVYGIIGYWSGSSYYAFYGNGPVGGTGFPNTSDERLKNFSGKVTGVLDKLDNINTYYYTWKENTQSGRSADGNTEIGVSAQEVQAQFPEVVTAQKRGIINGDNETTLEEELEETLAVDYGRLSSILIQAVKELKTQVEGANTRIEALEAQLTALQEV